MKINSTRFSDGNKNIDCVFAKKIKYIFNTLVTKANTSKKTRCD